MGACQYSTPGAAGEIKHVTLPGNDLAVTATHRLVVTGNRSQIDENIICMEPSPDAMSIAARSFALSAQIPGKGSGALGDGFNQAAIPLFARSQTIQAVRDTVTHACLAYRNGILPKFGYYMVIAAYPDLLLGMQAIEGMTDRPLQLSGGAFAPAPAISTTLSSEEGEEAQSASASVTTSISAAEAKFDPGGGPPATRLELSKEAVAAIQKIAIDLPSKESVFTAACLMYLSDEQVNKSEVGTLIYKNCQVAVGALTTSTANANSRSIKDIKSAVDENKKAVATLKLNVEEIKAKNCDVNLKQSIDPFVVEDMLQRQQAPRKDQLTWGGRR